MRLPWQISALMYIGAFGGTLLIVYCLQISLSPLPITVDSARYLLSALIQGQFATIAIIVTLTLIAMQLLVPQYSSNTVSSIKYYFDLWILLVIYIIAIAFELLTLRTVPLTDGNQTDILLISITIFLGLFTLVVLGPYLWNTMTLLIPEHFVQVMAYGKIKETRYWKENEVYTLQSIFDITVRAIDNSGFSTYLIGMNVLENYILGPVIHHKNNFRWFGPFSKLICGNVGRCGLSAVKNRDIELANKVIKMLEGLGIRAADGEFRDETDPDDSLDLIDKREDVVQALEGIIKMAYRSDLQEIVERCEVSIAKIRERVPPYFDFNLGHDI